MENIKKVRWQDLIELNRMEVIRELTLSIPWLVLSLYLASVHYYFVALICSFMFFLTGLRQVHNAFHRALGISNQATEFVMFVLSIVMLGSMHAVKINHLRHHKYALQDEDIEAKSAKMPWWNALLFGPIFPIMLHKKALEVGNDTQRSWVYSELFVNVLVLALVFLLLDYQWLQYHYCTMLMAQCMTAFFAVWTVHHDCHATNDVGRTIRNRFKAIITYNMFYHVEHHLFPRVPTCKLHIVSKRLDAHAPELCLKRVF